MLRTTNDRATVVVARHQVDGRPALSSAHERSALAQGSFIAQTLDAKVLASTIFATRQST